MKICLLGDTHFGVRNDSKHFHEFYERFYNEVFFPYLKKNKINTIIQLGDLFDRRKYINFQSLSESRRYFFDRLADEGIHLHALVGNHDIFWKHSLQVNSPSLLLNDYSNITIWQEPGKLTLDTLTIDIIPWMCNENEAEVFDFVSKSVSPVCVGHFELVGFSLYKGVESHEGIDHKFLDKYDSVYSGHFHTRSSNGNITYTGTPYEMVWSDYKDPKGFYVLDTASTKSKFVENPLRMFYKINYDDTNEDIESYKSIDYSIYKDSYVKIVVVKKQNPYMFDMMLDEINKALPIDVTIVEDFTEANNDSDISDIVDQAEDTMTILSSYIDNQKISLSTNKLKVLMRELYVEALSEEHTQ